jgi:hypothetical protein
MFLNKGTNCYTSGNKKELHQREQKVLKVVVEQGKMQRK